MAAVDAPLAHARGDRAEWVRKLAELVRIPSVSADPKRRGDVRRAAEWLATELRRVGLKDVRLIETPGNPAVYAQWRSARPAPTLLIYGHYDVVGPEPLNQWRSPPFSPVIRGRFLHGRGASDDKGPLLCHLAALHAWLKASGRLPVNVRCVFEGEEEIGSPHLEPVLRSVAAGVDAAVISDTRMLAPGRPALIVGLRGSLAAELEVRGPDQDLHSGAFGGAVHNPAQILCELVAGLHDEHGRVAIAGFYRGVRSRHGRRRSAPERIASAAVLGAAGARSAFGESGFTTYERTTLRPSLDVSGLHAGHTGAGVKSIVPARARAKLTMRLAPDQDPAQIGRLLRAHLVGRAPATAEVRLTLSKPARPVRIDPDAPALRAAARSLRAGFGTSPALLRSGGTIPVVELLAARMRIPTALMGFARPDDGMHAPNERVDLDALAAGTRSCIHFLELLALAEHRTHRARVGVPA